MDSEGNMAKLTLSSYGGFKKVLKMRFLWGESPENAIFSG